MKTDDVSIQIPEGSPAAPVGTTPERVRQPLGLQERVALGALVLLSAFLNFFQLQQNGYGNQYYASAVRSMLTSWHNFFFVSFDPGGFVTVDKPPLGLWIQTASSAIFGFSGWSLLLPQAVAGVLAVIVLYWLVRRTFGPVAGLLAGLALALTPISVVMNRDNNLDTLLVLTVLLAAWTLLKAAETGRLRWLLLCCVLVGLGFNIKTLEAYLVVPAFGLLYLLAAPLSWRTRILHLLAALLVLVLISFAWIAAVDLTPASQRPYVGSSQTNSELELALGYNGVERLFGMGSSGFGGRSAVRSTGTSATTASSTTAQAPDFPGGGGGPFNEGGPPSPLRLFKVDLGGQVSWLLPLALIGLLALIWQRRWRLPLEDRRQQAAVLWGVWLLTMGTFFSVAGFFHSYYLVMLAPAICALSAAGVLTMWHDYRERRDWRSWALPLAFVLTAAEQAYLLSSYQDWSSWLTPLILVFSLLAALALVVARLRPTLPLRPQSWQLPAVLLALLALLITPTVWDAISLSEPSNSTIPTAGPVQMNSALGRYFGEMQGGNRSGGMPDLYGSADKKLISYLEAHQGTTQFLLATTSSMTAAPIIIETGKPVMALGGFSGADAILTPAQLTTLIQHGTVRYFLLQSFSATNLDQALSRLSPQMREMVEQMMGGRGGGGPMGGFGSNSALTQLVTSHCTAVPTNQWQSQSQATSSGFPPSGGDLPGGPNGSNNGQGTTGIPGNAGDQGGFPGGPGNTGQGDTPGGQGGFPGFPGGPGDTGQGGFPGGQGGMGQQLYDCAGSF